MTLSVRTKLFLVSLALIAASMGAADAYLTPSVATHITQSIRADLLVRAHLVAREAEALRAPLASDDPAWDALADSLGRSAAGHVTFVRRDGVVLGDSDVATAEVPRLENHATRPEMEDALATGEGTAERMSSALQEPMLYAAVPFQRDGAIVGVARVAETLREVDRAKEDTRHLIWIGSALALGLALILSNVVARRMSSAVGELTDAARRMTEGDLSVRTRLSGHDELAELGHALDRLAGSLADDARGAPRRARPAGPHPRGDAGGGRRRRSRRAHRPGEPGAPLDAAAGRGRGGQAAHRDRAPRRSSTTCVEDARARRSTPSPSRSSCPGSSPGGCSCTPRRCRATTRGCSSSSST